MPRRQKEITDGSGIHTHPSSGQKLNPAAVSKPGNPGGVEVGSPVLTLMMLELPAMAILPFRILVVALFTNTGPEDNEFLHKRWRWLMEVTFGKFSP